jgi:SPP1 family predicted phage head-tail adaptor
MKRLRFDPGGLRQRVEIRQASLTSDGAGGFVEEWATIATVFAAIEPLSAVSRFGADRRVENISHRVTLRMRGDVASGMRLSMDGRVFEIRTVHDPDETGRWLVLAVQEEGR